MRRPALAVLILLLGGCATTPPVLPPNWVMWAAQDLPARVSGIVFPDGTRIDRVGRMTLGSWSAGYGAEPPVAEFQPNAAGNKIVKIPELRCRNAVVGEVRCDLLLNQPKSGSPGCGFDIYAPQALYAVVACPTAVELQR
jgi:hypothetical protein